MDIIISRSEARMLSCKKYYTGKACVNGHLAARYTGSGHCVICSLVAHTLIKEKNEQKTPLSYAHIIPLTNRQAAKWSLENTFKQ